MDAHSFQTEMKTQNEVERLCKAWFKSYENLSLENKEAESMKNRKRIIEQAKIQKDL